jgi:hypothetical protein
MAVRVYTMGWLRRAGALFYLVLGFFLTLASWTGPVSGTEKSHPFGMLISAAVLLFGLYRSANDFLAAVSLFPDAIEVRTLFKRERLPFSGIRGRREYVGYAGRSRTAYLKLEPNAAGLPSLVFEKDYSLDEEFFRWFNDLPDLDEADRKRKKESEFGLV